MKKTLLAKVQRSSRAIPVCRYVLQCKLCALTPHNAADGEAWADTNKKGQGAISDKGKEISDGTLEQDLFDGDEEDEAASGPLRTRLGIPNANHSEEVVLTLSFAEHAIVIDGKSLSRYVPSKGPFTGVSARFLALAMRCKVVICCRVSPLQKVLYSCPEVGYLFTKLFRLGVNK